MFEWQRGVLLHAGLVLALVGWLALVMQAFLQSEWWGVLVLLLPGAVIVFLFCHFQIARIPFMVHLVGWLMAVAGGIVWG